MIKTTTTECPKCGEELTVEWWRERHRVHNGIGMQTVAVDDHFEITDQKCDCVLDDPDLLDQIEESAADNYEDQKAAYADYKYDQAKQEGRL